MKDMASDRLRDLVDEKTAKAWARNNDFKHFDNMKSKHGEANVVACEACWRGVHIDRATLVGTQEGEPVHLGPTCAKKYAHLI